MWNCSRSPSRPAASRSIAATNAERLPSAQYWRKARCASGRPGSSVAQAAGTASKNTRPSTSGRNSKRFGVLPLPESSFSSRDWAAGSAAESPAAWRLRNSASCRSSLKSRCRSAHRSKEPVSRWSIFLRQAHRGSAELRANMDMLRSSAAVGVGFSESTKRATTDSLQGFSWSEDLTPESWFLVTRAHFIEENMRSCWASLGLGASCRAFRNAAAAGCCGPLLRSSVSITRWSRAPLAGRLGPAVAVS